MWVLMKTPRERFRMLSRINVFLDIPSIKLAIKSYQEQMTREVGIKINEYVNMARSTLKNNQKKRLLTKKYRTTSQILLLVRLIQIKSNLNKYMENLQEIWGGTPSSYCKDIKTTYQNIMQQLNKNLEEIIKKIVEKYNEHLENKKTSLIILKKQLHGSDLELHLNTDFRVAVAIKNLKYMLVMEKSISEKRIINIVYSMGYWFKKIFWKYYLSIPGFKDYIKTFNILSGKLDQTQTELLAGYLSSMYDKIQFCMDLMVNNTISYEVYDIAIEFGSHVDRLSRAYSQVNKNSEALEVILKELKESEVNHQVMKGIIAKAQSIVNDMQGMDCKNMEKFIETINKKIENILYNKLLRFIKKWSHEFNTFDESYQKKEFKNQYVKEITQHSMKIENQEIFLDPPIENSRLFWLSHLQAFLTSIITLPKLRFFTKKSVSSVIREKQTGRTMDNCFRELINQIPFELLNDAYSKVDEMLSNIQKFLRQWKTFESLWEINDKKIYEKLGNDNLKWQQLLEEIDKGQGKLFNYLVNEKLFGPVIIFYKSLQARVNSKYEQLQKDILKEFANTLSKQKTTFFNEIETARNKLQNLDMTDSDNVISAIELIREIRSRKLGWEDSLERLKGGEKILKKQKYPFPEKWIPISQVTSEWDRLQQTYDRREQEYNSDRSKIEKILLKEEASVLKKIKHIEDLWAKKKPYDGELHPKEALQVIEELEGMIEQNKGAFKRLNYAKELLGLPSLNLSTIKNIEEDSKMHKELWSELNKHWAPVDKIMNGFLAVATPEKYNPVFEQVLDNLKGLPSKFVSYQALRHKKEELRTLKKKNKIFKEIRTEAVKQHHWQRILKVFNVRKNYKNLLVGDIITHPNLIKEEKKIMEIISEAQGEFVLESMLKKIKDFWVLQEFDLSPYGNRCMLIRGWDLVITQVEDDLGQLNSMKLSQYYKIFEDEIKQWNNDLIKVESILEVWINVQKKWVYLEGIFYASQDIKQQLTQEYNKFRNVDSEFIALMKKVQQRLRVLEICQNIENLQKNLERIYDALEKIQKALSDYLETQRQAFSRFYFVGDEDLLEIIGNSKNIINIQKHFLKMFAGISTIENQENGDLLVGMNSKEYEQIAFNTNFKISSYGKINEWLQELETQMKLSLGSLLTKAVTEWAQQKDPNVKDLIEGFPAQIILISFITFWTFLVEEQLMKTSDRQLKEIVTFIVSVLEFLAKAVLGNLPKILRSKYEQLITDLVHKRDCTRNISELEQITAHDFTWTYNMRYYCRNEGMVIPGGPDEISEKMSALMIKTDKKSKKSKKEKKEVERIPDQLIVCVGNSRFDYGYEYLGIQTKLVQTPLTDKCYFTLTQALWLRMGGAPFGPAGTGKTESVKMLGTCLGRFVLVFNCDENFNFKAMGRIFIGLCQVGAWGCFDEFNRLEERILSAVSQQIQVIQYGLREMATQIRLMERNIFLNNKMGIFITMNPGYAGRSPLPENLKQLFRQLAMIVPDRELIAQVMLFSQGFKYAEQLAGKVVSLFELCGDQLSSQPHYDFGLRALKSVLNSAGNIKRKLLSEEEDTSNSNSVEKETMIILTSFCNTVFPKLISEDTPLLHTLIKGVFPKCEVPRIDDPQLREYLHKEMIRRMILDNEFFMEKTLQLNQILKLQHGVMLVGPAGCGKSVCWQLLFQCINEAENTKGEYYVIDPKAITKDELYGRLDDTTMEWTDGIFTHLLRKIIETPNKRQWVIFDGDVDPEWVENLNSVLDDNKLLTLPNGERLSIPDNMKIIFEVPNLKYATLATVSRCGMVWFSQNVLYNEDIYFNYLSRMKQDEFDNPFLSEVVSSKKAASIREKAVTAIEPFFFGAQAAEVVSGCKMNYSKVTKRKSVVSGGLAMAGAMKHVMIFTRIRVLEALFSLIRKGVDNLVDHEEQSIGDFNESVAKKYIRKWTLNGIIWSFVGDMSLAVRASFFEELQQTFGTSLKELIDIPRVDSMTTLIDYAVDIKTGNWVLYKDLVKNDEVDSNQVSNADVIIETVDTRRHQDILCSWLLEGRPFIICGPPGSGKTMTLMSTLKSLSNYEMIFVNFSATTNPAMIIKQFDHYCELAKSRGGLVLRPKQLNKNLVIFCDEINLPDEDQYGTQYVITFLRQLTERRGYWRISDKQWINLERIQFVGACNPPVDAGRHEMSPRFLRHAPVMLVDFPSYQSLITIYGTFNRAMLRKYPSLKPHADQLTLAMVDFYYESQKHFTADMQPHYIYSPRELTRWKYAIIEGLPGVNSLADLVRLWAHEGLRLFEDRLVYDEEKEWCQAKLDEIYERHFKSVSVSCMKRPILFSKYLSKTYSSVEIEDLREYVLSKLRTFSEEEYQIQLVVFDSVLDHIIRIDRVLRQPLGHCLLVGASGVGKTTLSRFVSWMNGLQVFQIKAGRNFTLEDFDANLRGVMKRSGCKGEKICFIFDESNVLSVAFMEKMNALLASGEIPGLFEGEEFNSLIATYKEYQGNAKNVESEEDIYAKFIKNVQRNLHVVFTMNPSNPDFSNRATSSPAIFNRCVIDWFGDWPIEALNQVAKELSEHIVIPEDSVLSDEDPHSVLVRLLVEMHESVKALNQQLRKNAKKFNYITPRDFLDLLKHFSNIFEEKYQLLTEQQLHLRNGLDKLKDTEEKVEKLDESLKKYQVQLKARDEEANKKLQMILKETKVAEKSEKELTKLQGELKEKRVEIKERKTVVQGELDEAGPALEKAKNAVNGLSASDLNDIKALNKPPPAIRLVMTAVCLLLKGKLCEWKEIRTIMKQRGFIDTVINLNVDKDVKESTKKKCGDFLKEKMKEGVWDLKAFAYSYKAAGPLSLWFESVTKFANLLRKVDPLKQEIKQYEKEEKKLTKQQKDLKKNLQDIKDKIEGFKVEYQELISKVEAIKNESQEVEKKVITSKKLLDNLSSENSRWTQSVEDFNELISSMTGDVLLSAGFVSYCGYFDQAYRALLLSTWKNYMNNEGLRYKKDISLVEYLCTVSQRMMWKGFKLPDDDLCTENAIILERYNRYPLIIDPTGQAMTFVLAYRKELKIKTTSFDSPQFMKVMENGLRFGLPVLIENVEKIDPLMNSILNKEVTKQGGRNLVRIGDQEIDFDSRFKLYMLTRDSETRFTPDICSRVTFVNFTITASSLENQCVNLYLKNEQPAVEKKRLNLLKLQGEFMLKLRKLEDDLLDQLSSSKGNLLDNVELITKLDNLKKEATEVQEQMDSSDQVLAEVERETNLYRPLSRFSSKLYFAMKTFNDIDTFYQFSFDFYMEIIFKLIKENERLKKIPKDQFQERAKVLLEDLFVSVYHNIQGSLKDRHKLLVALRFVQIRLGADYNTEFSCLFKAAAMMKIPDLDMYSLGGRLDKEQVEKLFTISKLLDPRDSLKNSILNDSAEWENFSTSDEYVKPPFHWYSEEDPVKRQIIEAVLTCIIRPNSAFWILEQFVSDVMTKEFLKVIIFDAKEVISKKTQAKIPIFLYSAPGFDPSQMIHQASISMGKKLESVALGSAEGFDIAKRDIERFQKTGGWVMLKNVHLATGWLKTLEENILNKESTHREFRIFLVSEFSPKIPSTLLRKSLKFVFENPLGIKANIKRFFPAIYKKNMFEKEPIERQRLYFHLVWIHAIIMERLRYTPIGWSKTYEFSLADLTCNVEIVNAYLAKSLNSEQDLEDYFIALRSIICNNVYGGKIDNDYDLKILKSLVDQYICREAFEISRPLVKHSGKTIVANFEAKTFEDYLEWINNLNLEESPIWAGLPISAEEVLNKQKIERLMTSLRMIQDINEEEIEEIKREEEEGSGQSNQFQWLKDLNNLANSFNGILKRQSLSKMQVTKESIKDPMFRFINRENGLAMKLKKIIEEHLVGLLQMSDGSDTRVGQDIKKIGRIVQSGQVPLDWVKYTILKSMNVSVFVEDFSKRINQLTFCRESGDWHQRGVELGKMFFPEAFFTATRQLVAMKTGLSLDELDLKMRLAPGEDKVDDHSFLIKGLTIEGVEWNSRQGIVISDNMSSRLENICFSWVKCSPGDQKKLVEREMFVPLYLNNSRQNLVLSVKLTIPEGCDISAKKLFQRAIALIAWKNI